MKKPTTIKIPENIVNEVKAARTQYNDLKKLVDATMRKLERAHKKMWWMIEDAIPETAEGNWALVEGGTAVQKNDQNGMPPFLKQLLSGVAGHEPGDEDDETPEDD